MANSESSSGIGCASKSSCSSSGKDGAGCASCASKKGQDPLAEQDSTIQKNLSRIKHVLFIMSGKGGVGKSSVTVNVAAALAAKGFKIGVLDVDLHGPSVARLFGLSEGLEMDEKQEKLIPAPYRENMHILSIDSLLHDKNSAILWRGPKKTAAIRQFISDVAWGELDFLVIDSPPGTGDEHMTILKAIPDALCVVVTTPQELALADVRKAMNFLQYSHGRVLGVVENMSTLVCPNCGENIDLFQTGGGKKLAEAYKVPFLGAIALDPMTVISADRGTPVVLIPEETQAKKDFSQVADAIAERAEKGSFVVMELPNKEE